MHLLYDLCDNFSAGQVFVSFRWVGGRICCRAMHADRVVAFIYVVFRVLLNRCWMSGVNKT